MWLDPIPTNLREDAMRDLDNGDVLGFLILASNTKWLDLVYLNAKALQSRGLYELALFDAWPASRTNNRHWPLHELHYMFSRADRSRLLAAGEPLPGAGPFTLYRGVAGMGRARRVRGFSWTADAEQARWFANRFKQLADPTVFQVSVQAQDVLFYTNRREEQEFVVLLPDHARLLRIKVS
jgi:hypothetical protein